MLAKCQNCGQICRMTDYGMSGRADAQRRRPRQALVDDQAHRIRADIDDGDRGPVVKPALGVMEYGGGTLTRP